MKKIVVALIVFSFFGFQSSLQSADIHIPIEKNITPLESDFCKGWKEGWENGYKYVKGDLVIVPLCPLCPLPHLNRDTYKDGYNRGFLAGKAKAEDE